MIAGGSFLLFTSLIDLRSKKKKSTCEVFASAFSEAPELGLEPRTL